MVDYKIVMNFNQLKQTLITTHTELYRNSVKAVNIGLTIRNWLFGYYIVEFEQNGEDRAEYGKQLLSNLAMQLSIKGLTSPELSRCRQFYNLYPQILGALSQISLSDHNNPIIGTLPHKFKKILTNTKIQKFGNIDESNNVSFFVKLLSVASYSHFVELIKIDDSVKRKFYELLIIKTNPSTRELQRQIHSLTFERLGLSANKENALELIRQKITPVESSDLVKSHYFFDFLNIVHPQFIEESELEQALINHLQDFIMELGNGFCFEARQKRILIDDENYFIDLVFYHRILKCHVLIELKTEPAKHEHIGQLKVYLQHYKHTVMEPGDNPPVGILLVTDKKKTLVEYAVADSDKEIFVSKYQLQLPDKKQLEEFINREIANL